jgi:PAS domain S-box-containing protein
MNSGNAPQDDRFARIVALAADAIICIDADHRITLFNHGAEVIFGYLEREVTGEKLDILIPQRFRHGHESHVSRFSGGKPESRYMGERQAIFALRKNGEEFPAEATISKIDLGAESLLTVVLRDVTKQKLVESELQRRVAERTAELENSIRQATQAQEQLLRSQRMEAYGQLTGGVAHDFNNLLTVIGGNLELMQDRLSDERSKALLARALNGVEMGGRLTQRLLAFARRSRLEPRLLDMNLLVNNLVDLLRRTIGESIKISSTLAGNLWAVQADASEIENALLNLAINARDAMPNGGRIVIETTNATLDDSFARMAHIDDARPGDYVRLAVSDSGVGMSEDVLSRAFEPFFTTKEQGRGTGLGLASIYGFVRQSGGYVTIYSELGKGTAVNIYLPRAKNIQAPDMDRAEPSARLEGHGLILVVEDNDGVRDITIERLEMLSFKVLSCSNAIEAKAVIDAQSGIDLVFSDVVMPGGLSGFDLAHWISEKHPRIKVLLTSGFSEELARGTNEAHAARVLSKPYSTGELARAIKAALES